jgi:hypothetical protein
MKEVSYMRERLKRGRIWEIKLNHFL